MSSWKKGESVGEDVGFKKGNAKGNGKPRGSGKKQRTEARRLQSELIAERLDKALECIDASHNARIAEILDYATLKGEYMQRLEQDQEANRRNRDKNKG